MGELSLMLSSIIFNLLNIEKMLNRFINRSTFFSFMDFSLLSPLEFFFYKVTNRIDDDIAVPFVNRRDGVRVDVHDALGEAVANALVHANYYGKRGIVIVKHGKKITISNPGTIRITKEEFYAGGNSDPRNPNLLKIFGFVNVGERAGSGVDKIMTAWEEQNWDR